MLHIETTDKNIKTTVATVAQWFIDEFKLNRFKFDIEFVFTKNLTKDTNGYAFTIWEDSPVRPREFNIEIDLDVAKAGGIEFIGTIIHEMVHIKQYLRGELKDCPVPQLMLWKNALVNTDDVDYLDQPWEVEAYALEAKLTEKYTDQADEWFE